MSEFIKLSQLSSEDRTKLNGYWNQLWGGEVSSALTEDYKPDGKKKAVKASSSKMKKVAQDVGFSVPKLVREMLMSDIGVNFDDAQRFADELNSRLSEADWLESFDGMQWNRKFSPKREEKFEQGLEQENVDNFHRQLKQDLGQE